MRFPSMRVLAGEAAGVFFRFPLVLTAALVAGICACVSIDSSAPDRWVRFLMGAQLGIPLLLALALSGERSGRFRWLLNMAGAVLIAIYILTLPTPFPVATLARFFQFNIAAHLLVAFLPYLRRNEPGGFWQFNKGIFLHLLKSLLFTAILVIGINVAMLALDKLFGLEIDDKLYFRVDLILLFVFNTWHFLGGVSGDLAVLEESRDFPRGLKVFAQYILAPLVALYLTLLMAYLVKVLMTAQWPSGWIGWLVSCVAAVGLFSLVLLHPLVDEKENRWIATYARAYFFLMIPSVGMLMVALAKRIGQYGFTENRYFMCVLSLWLLGVSVTGALKRLKRLEPLPTTLCLVAILASFGPWGAYTVARSSQMARLEHLLDSENLLADGKLVASQHEVKFETRREISAILDYLMQTHGSRSIHHWLTQQQRADLTQLDDSSTLCSEHRKLSKQVMVYLDLDYSRDWMRHPDRSRFSIQRRGDGEATALSAPCYLQRVKLPAEGGQTFTLAGDTLRVSLAENRIAFRKGDQAQPLLTLPLDSLLDKLRDRVRDAGKDNVPDSLLVAEAAGDSLRIRLLVDAIQWHQDEDGSQLQQLSGHLLIELFRPTP